MIIKKGQISQQFQLKVQGEVIPSIVENPIKCLGKWFDDTLGDKNSIEMTQKQVKDWLKRIVRKVLSLDIPAWDVTKTYVVAYAV